MKKGISGHKDSVGTGYITIPSGVDLVSFKRNCIRNSMVSIQTEENGRYDNVRITKESLNNIYFPITSDTLGSEVVYIIKPYLKTPIIIGVLSKRNELPDIDDGVQFATTKVDSSGEVKIFGDTKSGIIVSVNSKTNDTSKLKFKVTTKDGNGVIELFSDSQINIKSQDAITSFASNKIQFQVSEDVDSDKKTTFQYEKGVGFTYEDEFKNKVIIKDGQLETISKKTKIGSDSYTLKELLNDIIDEVCKITTTTTMGPQPPINLTQLTALKQKVEKILV